MGTVIIRLILALITLFLGAVLVYIVRQDRGQKRALILDVDALPEPVSAIEAPVTKNNTSKNGQKNNKKKR
jgi:hypothetical protein